VGVKSRGDDGQDLLGPEEDPGRVEDSLGQVVGAVHGRHRQQVQVSNLDDGRNLDLHVLLRQFGGRDGSAREVARRKFVLNLGWTQAFS